jgi:hypothetical protein
MSWYAVASFAIYSALLIWQATEVATAGWRALLAVPYLLIKLSVMLVALVYWDHTLCALPIDNVAGWVVFGGGIVLLREGVSTLGPILLAPEHDPRDDNLAVVLGLLTAVVVPALVLFFACRVALAHRCAI